MCFNFIRKVRTLDFFFALFKFQISDFFLNPIHTFYTQHIEIIDLYSTDLCIKCLKCLPNIEMCKGFESKIPVPWIKCWRSKMFNPIHYSCAILVNITAWYI